jgi:DNA-binding NarL/FixJ family response regulator
MNTFMNAHPILGLTRQVQSEADVAGSNIVPLQELEATRRHLGNGSATCIVVFAEPGPGANFTQADARSFVRDLEKQFSCRILTRAADEIPNGQSLFSYGIARRLPGKLAPRDGSNVPAKQTDPLTDREKQVLELIAQGKANKQTAAELCISIKTVEKHRQKLMKKLGIHETASLTRYAISAGIVPCDPLPGVESAAKPANLLVLKLARKKCPPPMLENRAVADVVAHQAPKQVLNDYSLAARQASPVA